MSQRREPSGLRFGRLFAAFGAPEFHAYLRMPVARIALFTPGGLFSASVLFAAAGLLPVMPLGIYCGNRLRIHLARAHFVRILGSLLPLSGISLLLRALSS